METSKRRLLIDTSVLLSETDEDAPKTTAYTKKFFDLCRTGVFDLFMSPQLYVELENKEEKRQSRAKTVVEELGIEELPVNEEAISLAERYRGKPLINSMGDRLHLAYATVFECATVVSWNMKDIVNKDTYEGTQSVNMEEGRMTITVETPAMILGEGRPEWLPPIPT